MAKRYQVRLAADQRLYLGVILILVMFLGYYNWKMALMGIVVLGSLLYYSWETASRQQRIMEDYLKKLDLQVETTAHDIIYNLPWPVAVSDQEGIIHWCNPQFVDLFPHTEILGKPVGELFPGIRLTEQTAPQNFNRNDRCFALFINPLEEQRGSNNSFLLFLQEITREEELEINQELHAPCIGLIQVDNYEEVNQSVEAEKRPLLVAAVDQLLSEWAAKKNGYLQKYGQDRYLVFLQQGRLQVSIEEKFPILDRVKEIKMGNKLPVTLSCGFGTGAASFSQLGELARAGLDLALGRGGDQVVVRDPERFHYFGGQTKALEKRTKIKARVIAQALQQLIEQTDQVLLMGHQGADMDSIGAAIGMAQAVRCFGRQAYIVLESAGSGVLKLLDYVRAQKDYQESVLGKNEALRLIKPASLLIVVDTHKPTLVAVPELLAKTNKIVVIDHHRRGEEFISDPTLVYLEAYASSASEMVTELLQYLGKEIEIGMREATALLAGITVDTKNYSYQVGVRTFEAAAFLRRLGADPEVVRRVLQADLETFVTRAEVIKKAQVFYQRVALGVVPQTGEKAQLVAAQAADELLTIEGIEVSFVLAEGENGVIISARASGDVNVQVIMERLGGGGHMNMAGCQLEDVTLSEAKKMVVELIHEYFAGEVLA
jgi:c-di-AMP phosphodiesterase-like protein